MRLALLTLATAALAACSTESYAPLSTSSDSLAQADLQVEASAPRVRQKEESSANPSTTTFMAYRYDYGFTLPAEAVTPTLALHRDRCLDAGPDRCQVLGSNTNSYGESSVVGRLYFRAEPGFLSTFLSNAEEDIASAKGERSSFSMTSEDVTRQYLDTDARLSAQTALRDRLLELLKTRNADLADLLRVEQEVARVQAQIESATTTLEVLRRRVSMSEVEFNYRSRAVAAETAGPVGRAFATFGDNIAMAFASIIVLVSFALPFILLAIPLLWLLAWALRRRRSRRATA